LPKQHGQAVLQYVLEQRQVKVKNVLYFELQPLVNHKNICNANQKADNAGNQRRNRRTLYTERREAEVPENQYPIQRYTYRKRCYVGVKRDLYDFYTTQHVHQHE
jgi:hypothetical protein